MPVRVDYWPDVQAGRDADGNPVYVRDLLAKIDCMREEHNHQQGKYGNRIWALTQRCKKLLAWALYYRASRHLHKKMIRVKEEQTADKVTFLQYHLYDFVMAAAEVCNASEPLKKKMWGHPHLAVPEYAIKGLSESLNFVFGLIPKEVKDHCMNEHMIMREKQQ